MLLNSMLLGSSGRSALQIRFKTTSQIVAVYVSNSGSPNILWTWSDGTMSTSASPGAQDFGSAATRYHTLFVDDWSLLTAFNFVFTASTEFDLLQLRDKTLGSCNVYLDDTSVTGNIVNLPSGLTGNVSLDNTAVVGDIANLPSGLTGNVSLDNTAVVGDIANLPSGLTGHVLLSSTGVTVYTPGTWPCNTGNGKSVLLQNLSMSQASVDGVMADLDTHGATGGTLNLSTNSIPSAAGLVSKTNLEGKGWTVTVDS